MTDANRQILNLSRDGFSATEIADALGYSEEAVSIVLLQAPRSQSGLTVKSESPAGTPESLEERFKRLQEKALDALEVLMTGSEDDNVKSRLAMYVLDQRLGLKKPARAGHTINIVNIQEDLNKARQLYGSAPTIDIAPLAQLEMAS